MRPSLKLKFRGIAILFIILAGTLSFWSHRKVNQTQMGRVTRGDLIQKVSIAGTMIPKRKTVISAPYNGYVRKLYVQIGSQVRSGDPIVSFSQSLREAESEIYPLRAPFSGTVVQVHKGEGEYVEQQSAQGSGSALVRIDDFSQMLVEAHSPEIDVGKLKIGMEAIIRASAVLDHTYLGKIHSISLAAKEQTDWDKSRVEFPVMIQVMNPDPQIKPGMSVIVDIITSRLKNVLTLNHEFIQQDGDQYFVMTQKGERKNIDVGIQNEEVFEIKKGLDEGEKILQIDFLSMMSNR